MRASDNAESIRATRAVFLAAGLSMAAWGPLVPVAKARLGLDERTLGLLLLCLGLGSVMAMPFSGALAARFGCRSVIMAAGSVAVIALMLLPAPLPIGGLAVTLAVFGAGVGTVDVVMNIQATIVERETGRAMMSGFHGLFSVGGLIGASGVTGLLWRGVSPPTAILLVAVIAASLVGSQSRGLLVSGGRADGPPFVRPRGVVIVIGLLCFLLFLTEGAMLDWSGVFLTQDRGFDPTRAGLGYVAFAAAMTLGRLTGDRIVGAFGAKRVLVAGAALSAGGLLLAAAVPHWGAGLLGFALVGAGASNSVPILFSAAGRQGAMPPSLAIAAATTMGYGGILIGPAAIGFVARATTLPIALGIVAVLLFAVAIVGPSTIADGD